MNDKKDYTREILPDGSIRQNMEGKEFLQYRTKKSFDSAEKELRRSLNVILNDIRKFKSAAKNIKTEKEQEELLLQLDSSLATINKLLDDEPLLKEYVSDIKIDEKLLREFGYSPNAFEIMRERARIRFKAFQEELLKLEDEVMNIDFTNISPLQKTIENSKPSKEQQENSSNEYHFKVDFLNDLFEQCKDYFKCSESKFKVAMEEANFNEIIQREGCVITRCFILIAVIGKKHDDWYTDAIKNINRIDKYKDADKSYASGRINNYQEWADTIESIREQHYKK